MQALRTNTDPKETVQKCDVVPNEREVSLGITLNKILHMHCTWDVEIASTPGSDHSSSAAKRIQYDFWTLAARTPLKFIPSALFGETPITLHFHTATPRGVLRLLKSLFLLWRQFLQSKYYHSYCFFFCINVVATNRDPPRNNGYATRTISLNIYRSNFHRVSPS